MAAPTIDGTPAHKSVSTVSSTTLALTTSLTNDIIVLCSYNENQNTALRTISSVSGGGLTWQVRKSLPNQTNHQAALESWWAFAPAALSNVTFTINLSGTTDDWSLAMFGVNGCNTSSPWDSNASLPGTLAFNGGTTNPSIAGLSTTQANDLLIAFLGGVNNTDLSVGQTPPTGFSFLAGDHTNGGALDSCIGVWDKGVAAITTNATYAFTLNPALSDATMIVDALTADSAGPGVAGNWRRIGMPAPWQMGI